MTIAHVHIPLLSDETMEAMRDALVHGVGATFTTFDREFAEIKRKPPPHIADHAAFAFEETWRKAASEPMPFIVDPNKVHYLDDEWVKSESGPGHMTFIRTNKPRFIALDLGVARAPSADDRAVHAALRLGSNDDKRYGVAQYVGEGE